MVEVAASLETIVAQRIHESITVKTLLLEQQGDIAAVADRLIVAYQKGGKVLLFGNGGSAADAQHIAAELVGRYYMSRAPLTAVALTTNTSVLTAISNDFGYDQVFARQVAALGRPGDVAIGLSTSGRSANVLQGLREARRSGLTAVALTGGDGMLQDVSDYTIMVPSADTPRIQEAHILIGHIWCELVERALFQTASTETAG